ncbi:FAD-dependent thymidylate synthase [Prevotella sp.]|uniref:FAD-dependent thymidylate synthase n=1 Tax=Prevotella sp. TaxID=59823 RepID=UPI002648B5DD|nr:FAD-dependent thymidylate synthase [Prevotella sp.]MDN5552544.1 FAD-dependent thymidylate synthase [Prevotella sp.]
MKILNPSFEIWQQENGLAGVYKLIEQAGRVCYKSEKNTTETSAKPFVERMIASQHTAMLEHGTIYLTAPKDTIYDKYNYNRFSIVATDDKNDYVTTNLRVIVENKWLDDLKYISNPTKNHEMRITVHFTTQVAITREFNRHRANSMAEQSTRYCNYTKDKFGSEISVNVPKWIKDDSDFDHVHSQVDMELFKQLCNEIATEKDKSWNAINNWLFANLAAEFSYMNLIAMGKKPQEARVVLPLDTNTELVHTAFLKDWKHFFDLRAIGTTGEPHPDAKAIAMPLNEEFKKLGLIK